VEALGFIIVDGPFDTTEGSVMIIEEDGWYFGIPDHAIAQESAP